MNVVHHSLLAFAAAGTACIFTACQNPASAGPDEDPPLTPSQTYVGSSSAGGCMTMIANRSTRVISYDNLTTLQKLPLSYQIQPDESYSILNPQGHLITAWENPGYALIGTSTLSDPPTGEPSLITALPATVLTRDTLARGTYNMLLFRTREGGIEAGWLEVDAGANLKHQTYSPFRDHNESLVIDPFQTAATWNSSTMSTAAGGRALAFPNDPADPDGPVCHVFQSSSNLLAVDTPEGSMICLRQTALPDFDNASMGTYNGVIYRKGPTYNTLPTGPASSEPETPSMAKCRLLVSGSYIRILVDGMATALIETAISPVASDTSLVNAGSGFPTPCNGMFTFEQTDNVTNISTRLFVVFQGQMAVFGCYSYDTTAASADPANQSKPYSYYYGSALKWSDTLTAPRASN